MPAQPPTTLAELRRYAIRRTLFTPGTLARAVERLGYVQADPIRSPARAQDLILRPRVRGYRAGDLERRYTRLAVEEDFFEEIGDSTRFTLAELNHKYEAWEWEYHRTVHGITGEEPLSRLPQLMRDMVNRNGNIKTAIIP